MLTKEQKALLSVITVIMCTVASVCLYGFTIGGAYLCFKYLLYCVITSFVMTGLAFLFIFGKKVPRKLIWKEIYTVLVLSVAALQILLYQPLNLLTAEDKVTEYEVEITDSYHRSYDVFFTDKDGVAQKAKFYSIFSTDDELWPEAGGKMIIRETLGGFNCKHFEIIKVTYEPEIYY